MVFDDGTKSEHSQSASDRSNLSAQGKKKMICSALDLFNLPQKKILPTQPKKKRKAYLPLLKNIIEMTIRNRQDQANFVQFGCKLQ